jgi:hypothetical protein
MQSFPLCQQCQPPITPRFAIGLTAPEQIALANHADRRAVAIHNRCSTDPVSKKQLRDFGRRGIGRDGNRVLGHKLARLHREILIVRGEAEFSIRRSAHSKWHRAYSRAALTDLSRWADEIAGHEFGTFLSKHFGQVPVPVPPLGS